MGAHARPMPYVSGSASSRGAPGVPYYPSDPAFGGTRQRVVELTLRLYTWNDRWFWCMGRGTAHGHGNECFPYSPRRVLSALLLICPDMGRTVVHLATCTPTSHVCVRHLTSSTVTWCSSDTRMGEPLSPRRDSILRSSTWSTLPPSPLTTA